MAKTNAQRQKEYRDRLAEHGIRTATVTIHADQYRKVRALGARLRREGPETGPFPLPVTDGETAVLLQVLRSIRSA